MLGGYMRSTLAAVMQWAAPLKPMRGPGPAPAEIEPADAIVLDRLRWAQDRAAIVMSLWAAHPARQCTVAARYDTAPPNALPNVGTAQQTSARALQKRLAMNFDSAPAMRAAPKFAADPSFAEVACLQAVSAEAAKAA